MTITAPGLYPNFDYQSTRTPTRALSYSGIKILLDQTPADFIAPSPRSTRDMDFGSIVHALALGKGSKFVISPYDDYKTKLAREWRDETIANGVIPIKQDKFDDAEAIAEIIRDRIDVLLGGAKYETEVAFFWQEDDTWCSGMADVWCDELSTVIDPKVTSHLHGDRAKAHMYAMRYDIQSAWYRRGLETIFPDRSGKTRFVDLLVSPIAPFTSRPIEISEAWRHTAERDCLRALRLYDKCVRDNDWPSYPVSPEILDAPGWAATKAMEAEMEEEEDESI